MQETMIMNNVISTAKMRLIYTVTPTITSSSPMVGQKSVFVSGRRDLTDHISAG